MSVLRESRALRVMGLFILLDLVLALLALGAYKLLVYPKHRPLFLLLVNVNMIICALAALVSAVVLRRRTRRELTGADTVVCWLLLAAAGGLVIGEISAFALEFLSDPQSGATGPEALVSLASRLGVVVLAGWAAFGPLARTHRTEWTTAAALAVVAAAVWGATLVGYPMWLDGHEPVLLAMGEVLALALAAVALRRGGAGSPRLTPARFYSLAGLSLYLVTDLYYLQHMARGDESFCVAEMGFYVGYMLVAWGAARESASDPLKSSADSAVSAVHHAEPESSNSQQLKAKSQ